MPEAREPRDLVAQVGPLVGLGRAGHVGELVGVGEVAGAELVLDRRLHDRGRSEHLARGEVHVVGLLVLAVGPGRVLVRVLRRDAVERRADPGRERRVLVVELPLAPEPAVEGEIVVLRRDAAAERRLAAVEVVVAREQRVGARLLDRRLRHHLHGRPIGSRGDVPGRRAAHCLVGDVDVEPDAVGDPRLEAELVDVDLVAVALAPGGHLLALDRVLRIAGVVVVGARLGRRRIGGGRTRESGQRERGRGQRAHHCARPPGEPAPLPAALAGAPQGGTARALAPHRAALSCSRIRRPHRDRRRAIPPC